MEAFFLALSLSGGRPENFPFDLFSFSPIKNMTYHAEGFDIELQDENEVAFEDEKYLGMTLPFRPMVGDTLMIRGTKGEEFEILKVAYFNGLSPSRQYEFVGFLLTVRKLSP